MKTTLGEHLVFRNGKKSPERTLSGHHLVYGANGVIGRSDESNTDQESIVIGRVGSYCGSVSFAAPGSWVTENSIIASARDRGLSRFFYYVLSSVDLRSHSHGSGQPLLNHEILSSLELNIPEPRVQRSIGKVLGALDDKIAANRAAISTGQNLIQAQWEQQSSGANEVRNLDEVVDLNPRTQLPAEGPHPFLDMKDLPQNGLLVDRWSERESRSGSKFRNGDTLLARITPCFENGKIGLVDFLPPDVTGLGSTEYIVLRPKDGVPQAVPYCVASSDPFRAHAARGMTGTSGRQRVQAINVGDYPVGWPEQDALDRFGGFTDALLRRLSAARNENTLLARTRDELLPLLMNGRITVKDAERAAEDVL